MTERELDRRLADWLASRDPGVVPDSLRATAARVPYEIRPPLGARIADAFAARWAIPRLWTTRVSRLALVVLLVLAMLVALAVVGSRQPEPNELVRLSQAVHRNPPAFVMTIRPQGEIGCATGPYDPMSRIEWRYRYDGAGTIRRECLVDGVVHDYLIENTLSGGGWSGTSWTTGSNVGGDTGVPIATVNWLNWVGVGELVPGVHRPDGQPVDCPAWALGPVEPVAGRAARIVSCGPDRYWIDEASLLLVRIEFEARRLEASELQVGQAQDPALFEIPERPRRRTLLQRGEVPPTWILPRVGGGSFDLASLRGRPAAVLIGRQPCIGPCLALGDFAAVVGQRSDRLNAAAITGPRLVFPGAELAQAAAAGLPVAEDNGEETIGWEIEQDAGSVVLFDADDRVVDFIDARSRASLAAAVDSLLAGTPLPLPPVGDGVFVPGNPAPALTAELLNGGTIDFATLRGRPVVVLSPAWESAAGIPTKAAAEAQVTEIVRAQRLVGEVATFVVIAWGEAYTGPPPPVWHGIFDRVRARVGATVDDLVVIHGQDYGSSGPGSFGIDSWDALQLIGGDPYRWDPAIVILDRDGLVNEVLWGDTLPDGSELAAIVSRLIAAQQ